MPALQDRVHRVHSAHCPHSPLMASGFSPMVTHSPAKHHWDEVEGKYFKRALYYTQIISDGKIPFEIMFQFLIVVWDWMFQWAVEFALDSNWVVITWLLPYILRIMYLPQRLRVLSNIYFQLGTRGWYKCPEYRRQNIDSGNTGREDWSTSDTFVITIVMSWVLTSMPKQNWVAGPYCRRHWWWTSYITPGGITGKSNSGAVGSSFRQCPQSRLWNENMNVRNWQEQYVLIPSQIRFTFVQCKRALNTFR